MADYRPPSSPAEARQYLADLPARLLDGALAGLRPYTWILTTVDAAIDAVIAETPDTKLQIGQYTVVVRAGELVGPLRG